MGVDLTLLPFDHDSGGFAYSHTVLQVGRHYEFFDWINTLPQIETPLDFTSYVSRESKCPECGDSHYGQTTETPYGERLKYTMVYELLAVPLEFRKDFTSKEQAVWAYLEKLDRYTKVALFWH